MQLALATLAGLAIGTLMARAVAGRRCFRVEGSS